MDSVTREQIRHFRLCVHHLDRWYPRGAIETAAGACGFQNTPPGAFETALHNRISGISPDEIKKMLEEEKTLIQSWSFRGAPVVFPAAGSDAFLSALIPEQDEPWIYTRGIQLALDCLRVPFDELLRLLTQVMPKLDDEVIKSKTSLDETLAQWVAPLLPAEKRAAWGRPSMYGNPEKQTVGGAVVSFLLRPCAFLGLVVFGRRAGTHPTFTSYKNWTGHALKETGNPARKLVQKYLHCFGPASAAGFANWLGCSPAQATRMWQTAEEEMIPVQVAGKERYLLSQDRELLFSPPSHERQLHLLGGHDPYLGLQDRDVILDDTSKQRQIWQTISNPGAVLWQGEIAGIWRGRKKGRALEIEVSLWNTNAPKKEIRKLGDEYADNHQLNLNKITLRP